MDKILSINTIKNVFAALGAKTSDSNYGVALLDKTTAEPKGLMGISDLASVLGVTGFSDFEVIHVDNITKTCIKGMFTETPSTYGLPATRGNYIVITMYQTPSNPDGMGVQICYNQNGSSLTRFIRSKDSLMSWSAWAQL